MSVSQSSKPKIIRYVPSSVHSLSLCHWVTTAAKELITCGTKMLSCCINQHIVAHDIEDVGQQRNHQRRLKDML